MKSLFNKEIVSLSLLFVLFCGKDVSGQNLPVLGGKELAESCKRFSKDNYPTVCSAYIQGFLDASPSNIAYGKMPSDYVLRAMKTRAPQKDKTLKATVNARYCIPDEHVVQELAQKIAGIKFSPEIHKSSINLLTNVLDTHYLCDQ